jgi:hypothetical protein
LLRNLFPKLALGVHTRDYYTDAFVEYSGAR